MSVQETPCNVLQTSLKEPLFLRPFCPPNSHASFFLFFPFFPSFPPTLVSHRMGHRGRTTQRKERDTVRYSTSGSYRYVEIEFPDLLPLSPSAITWSMNGLMNGCLEGGKGRRGMPDLSLCRSKVYFFPPSFLFFPTSFSRQA